ncbi:UDP-N-acetylmuramoyl-tripeptide--D-alanyl-D-alanine ligase [Mycetocola zhadangensis]|uniref:UDP-N-acetylmuramoyl-tripeptide--D-alanyl-D-alanine ligase n=1 Tax=Mycetocola zhadangensis TaxID=1164595 RepID=A0A3L7J742_9MICO|nr:UDP-N-acetylmuramoyl-tripeptide--D-alanyl-D-alanine ligase [Mycetocola zhadangensis]RLQ86289.1 UDP-N-acetylmuramoyl-tripeptide--D-alanyl-D-alanine ligase [Mycetocola zhadangensis]GGE89896.1 UDP-N-acetylmuramoyl-tripeptide--D-alanyl-D-alanine ligase [Mycetocola zhadangensis]
MIRLTLSEIAERLSGSLHLSETDATGETIVDGPVETDSREIVPGGVFVAKRGDDTDGHLFVGAAVDRGAALAIVEHPVKDAIAQIVVSDAVIALGEFAQFVVERVRSAGDLTVIGITGSNGKTTTKNMLERILSEEAETVAPVRSFNNAVGAPTTMLRITESTRYLIVEMGASGIGHIARLVELAKPDIGVVLKVGLAHAGGFGGIESTLAAKTEMVADLDTDSIAVLNADDARVASMADKTRASVLTFGENESAMIRATDIVGTRTGTTFIAHAPDEEPVKVRLRVLGEHHVSNALAALTVASTLGVPLARAAAALETLERAERWRMEVLGGKDDVTIINDAYNASPDSMAAAIKTLAQISEPSKRTIAVLGAMSELGEYSGDEHDRIGLQLVRLNISRLVVVGPEARRMHISAINEGSWDGESVYFGDMDAAYDYLAAEIIPGDTVLVKSSNSAQLRFLGDRLGELFSW